MEIYSLKTLVIFNFCDKKCGENKVQFTEKNQMTLANDDTTNY